MSFKFCIARSISCSISRSAIMTLSFLDLITVLKPLLYTFPYCILYTKVPLAQAASLQGIVLKQNGVKRDIPTPCTRTDSLEFLDDMKRRNEVESDHRNIMTPEFREFCITSREHIICWVVFLSFFILALVIVRRVYRRLQPDCSVAPINSPRRQNKARYLVTPYSSTFRARQLHLIIASVSLAGAMMLALILPITVALSNVMDYGNPENLTSWRTWLLPHTLMSPEDTAHERMPHRAYSVGWTGPEGAHDFPPVLRRLWSYQLSILLFSSVFLIPFGILFEGTPRRATIKKRVSTAIFRWIAMAVIVLSVWTLVCRRAIYLQNLGLHMPFASDGASMRYSLYYAFCIFGSLPGVLLVAPRGTWALLNWFRCSFGQTRRAAYLASFQYKELKTEQRKIERSLQRTIRSWKWEHVQDTDDFNIVDNHNYSSSSSGDQSADELGFPSTLPRRIVQPKGPNRIRPPLHPSLKTTPRSASNLIKELRAKQHSLGNKTNGLLLSFEKRSQFPISHKERPSATNISHDKMHNLRYKRSLTSFTEPPSSDDGNDDGNESDLDFDSLSVPRVAGKSKPNRTYEREHEMQKMAHQIRRYHAQIMYIKMELLQLEKSGLVTEDALQGPEELPQKPRTKGSRILEIASNGSSVIITVVTIIFWCLVVLQVLKGVLSVIFVGEPDLTRGFTYFIPALSTNLNYISQNSQESLSNSHSTSLISADSLTYTWNWPQLMTPSLITLCQITSSALLFIVVMFGILSIGTSFEESVRPLRFLAFTYSNVFLRARQWNWIPTSLLGQSVLNSITPIIDQKSYMDPITSNSSSLVGNTSRIFFLSSSDLSSFYHTVLRETAQSQSQSQPATVLPVHAVSKGFLQARRWGRRVFLLFGQRGVSIQPRKLLIHIWLICTLSMTWPGVLRASGLISERAYLLPITSLVQPLWDSHLQLEDEIELHPISEFYADSDAMPDKSYISPAKATNTHDVLADTLLSHIKDTLYGSQWIPSDDAHTPKHQYNQFDTCEILESSQKSHARYADIGDSSESTTKLRQKKNFTLFTDSSAIPDRSGTRTSPALLPSRMILRRSLLQPLQSSSVLRWVVWLALKMARAYSPGASVALGSAVWWSYPDLIVPLSKKTLNLQLGYTSRTKVSIPWIIYGVSPEQAEWYSMLRRVQQNSVGLPQARDGTPYMIHSNQASATSALQDGNTTIMSDQHRLLGKWKWLTGESHQKITQIVHFAYYNLTHGFQSIVSAAVMLMRKTFSLLISQLLRICDSVLKHILPTPWVGSTAIIISDLIMELLHKLTSTASIVWSSVLRPILLGMDTLIRAVASELSMMVHLVLTLLGDSISLRDHENSTASASALDMTSVVPVIFMPAYWQAASVNDGPVTQRLRPDLWPHVFNDDSGNLAYPWEMNQLSAQNAEEEAGSHEYRESGALAYGILGNKGSIALEAIHASNNVLTFASTTTAAGQVLHTNIKEDNVLASISTLQPDLPLSLPTDNGKHVNSISSINEDSLGNRNKNNIRPIRESWTVFDCLLALYRILLAILAARVILNYYTRQLSMYSL